MALSVLLALPGAGDAEERKAPERRVAMVGLDSLGMDAERVSRLETLFRIEIDRLSRARMPSPRRVREVLALPQHRGCGSESRCLISVGKALGVDVVVAGNVAALGDAYVVDIKAVDVAEGTEIARVASEPLRGDPDDLIDNVRVAAYQLLAPGALRGSINLLVDLDGAEVWIDGEKVGVTPLARPIGGLSVGTHRLEIRAEGYDPARREIEVKFQKSSRVVVSLSGEVPVPRAAVAPPGDEPPFYRSRWFWTAVGVGVAATVAGALIGSQLGGGPEVVTCPGDDRC